MATESESVSLRQILDVVRSQSDTIKDFQSQVSNELTSIKQEVHGSSDQVKKMKTDALVKWRSEGNRIQFTFNSDVCDQLTQINWAIENNKSDYAKELVESLTETVKRRNKLIKITDTSDGGWDTVRQYESNPIASDSEDESRINRAESRALKKRKNAKQKANKSASYRNDSGSASADMQLFRGPQWFAAQPAGYHGAARGGARRGLTGVCFGCGSFSHWRSECPNLQISARPGAAATATKPKSE